MASLPLSVDCATLCMPLPHVVGESLLVADAHDGFIWHILAHPNGQSAIWAAQRVPDDHVGVVST